MEFGAGMDRMRRRERLAEGTAPVRTGAPRPACTSAAATGAPRPTGGNRKIGRSIGIKFRIFLNSVFLNFLLWVKELVDSDCTFGFLMTSCRYGQLDMSTLSKFDPNIPYKQIIIFINLVNVNFSSLDPKIGSRHRQNPILHGRILHWDTS